MKPEDYIWKKVGLEGRVTRKGSLLDNNTSIGEFLGKLGKLRKGSAFSDFLCFSGFSSGVWSDSVGLYKRPAPGTARRSLKSGLPDCIAKTRHLGTRSCLSGVDDTSLSSKPIRRYEPVLQQRQTFSRPKSGDGWLSGCRRSGRPSRISTGK